MYLLLSFAVLLLGYRYALWRNFEGGVRVDSPKTKNAVIAEAVVETREDVRLRRPGSMGVCVPVANLSKRREESERELSLTGNHQLLLLAVYHNGLAIRKGRRD